MRTALVVAGVLVTAVAWPAHPTELKIAAWNIEHLKAGVGEGCKARTAADFKRLRDYAEELDADVVAFQEVTDVEAARRAFPASDYAIEISRRDAGPGGSCRENRNQRFGPLHTGFAIRQGVPYSRNSDIEELASGGRHGVDITVFSDGRALRLLSVHLKSGCFSNSNSGSACEKLRDQIPHVESWLDTRTREGLPAIALGDFNRRLTQSGDQVWADLNDQVPADYTALTEGHVQTCKGRFQGEPYIDHLVLNPMAAQLVASDLQALVYVQRQQPSGKIPR